MKTHWHSCSTHSCTTKQKHAHTHTRTHIPTLTHTHTHTQHNTTQHHHSTKGVLHMDPMYRAGSRWGWRRQRDSIAPPHTRCTHRTDRSPSLVQHTSISLLPQQPTTGKRSCVESLHSSHSDVDGARRLHVHWQLKMYILTDRRTATDVSHSQS